jgi:hypothetical protein
MEENAMSVWLYPISSKGKKRFFYRHRKSEPVSLEAYEQYLKAGKKEFSPWWSVFARMRDVAVGDQVLVYCGEEGAGIIGYFEVEDIDYEDKCIKTGFDINRSRQLFRMRPVPSQVVRQWIHFPRRALMDLDWYAKEVERHLPWIKDVRIDHQLQGRSTGGGYGRDHKLIRKVEQAAIKKVTQEYRKTGWSVEDHQKKCLGYDLYCRKKRLVRLVEVKGTRGEAPGFQITAGELARAKSDSRFVLRVVVKALSSTPEMLRAWTGKQMLDDFRIDAIQYRAILARRGTRSQSAE